MPQLTERNQLTSTLYFHTLRMAYESTMLTLIDYALLTAALILLALLRLIEYC